MSGVHVLLVLSVCLTLVLTNGALVGKECTDDSQCAAGECCQILSQYMVVSKRADTGTCQPYSQEGDHCGLFDKMNGYCSCAPGLHCEAVPVPLESASSGTVQKRKLVPPPDGYTYNINCVKDV